MKGNKILLLGLIFILIFSSIPYNVSSLGEQTDYIEDYEDDALTNQNPTDNYYGYQWIRGASDDYTYCYVDNTYKIDTKSYRAGRSGYSDATSKDVYINLSINGIIDRMSWFGYWDFSSASLTTTGGEQYRVYSGDSELFRILHKKDGESCSQTTFFYEDVSGHHLIGIIGGETWQYFEIKRNANDSFTVKIADTEYTGGILAGGLTKDGNITRILIDHWEGNGVAYKWNLWVDNVRINSTISPSEEDEEKFIPPCCAFCDDIGEIGMGGVESFRYWNQPPTGKDIRFLYTEYNVPVTGNLTRIDLQLGDEICTDLNWIGNYFSVNDILCKVNDNSLGHADELVEIGNTGIWRISWVNLNIEVENEQLHFIFKSYADFTFVGNQGSWDIFSVNSDLNSDGQKFFAFLNENFEGFYSTFTQSENYKTLDTNANGVESIARDLIMRICFDPIDTSWELFDFVNDILLGESTLCTNESISVSYFINTTAMLFDDKYIYIDKQGSGVVNGYPVKLYAQDDTFYYTPTEQGTYYVNLSLNGVNVTSKTFLVNCFKNDYVYTVPNPSGMGEKVRIYYGYTFPTFNASLRVLGTTWEWLIPPSSMGYKEQTFNLVSKYQIELNQYNHILNTYIFVDSHLHEVSSDVTNYLSVNPRVIQLGMTTTISGSQAHFGQNVWVKIGDTYERNVGGSDDFSFRYKPDKAGKFDVLLVLKIGNNEVVLTESIELVVGLTGEDADEPDILSEWGITGDKKQYLGWGIVLIFILVPLKVKSEYEEKFTKEVKFPVIIYLACACTGVGVSVGLGLLDIWWVLLIVLVAVASTVYMVFYGKKD